LHGATNATTESQANEEQRGFPKHIPFLIFQQRRASCKKYGGHPKNCGLLEGEKGIAVALRVGGCGCG
jgi:hypothetical protein